MKERGGDEQMIYVLAYDIGTTGVKTCLFRIDETITLLAGVSRGYGLYILENGGAEQDEEEWWQAVCGTTKELFDQTAVRPEEVAGISFCSQMQGLILVDREGKPVRRPMSYMDQRAREEIRKGLAYGPQIAGANIFRLIRCLRLTGAVSTSVKDPMWKYKWIEAHEPDQFRRADKWLDVKEYLIRRLTGNCVMTEDSAFATLLYDTRKGKEGWSEALCRMFGVKMEHLPKIIRSSDQAGTLTEQAAAELGLPAGIPVFGGGGDASLIGVGSGCVQVGETHIYCGTSGWVGTVTDRQLVDVSAMIAAIVGAQRGRYNYFAEMETAGKCLEWVKDHLALDEIGIYLEKVHVAESHEAVYRSLYDYMTQVVEQAPAGAGGVIFTPWLHGNRCPFEDPAAAGMFFGIRLETGKTELIRAVLEGICYHLRWMLECEERKVKTSPVIRFVGGGALSPVTSQILSDVTGRVIEVVESPQNVGAVGAAAVAAVGLGVIESLDQVKDFIPVSRRFEPDMEKKAVYDKYFEVFKKLYQSNKKIFRRLQYE
ncbi:MAG TPA: FGGY-family carbohydrate kinase [Firmicutes bacterium]|nr:FGGY-family carbohydrate kinase [Bacillota bacterium]